jgi:hypothetical protein
LFGEDYGVVHRNGSVTVRLRQRPKPVVDERFGGPLWRVTLRSGS